MINNCILIVDPAFAKFYKWQCNNNAFSVCQNQSVNATSF